MSAAKPAKRLLRASAASGCRPCRAATRPTPTSARAGTANEPSGRPCSDTLPDDAVLLYSVLGRWRTPASTRSTCSSLGPASAWRPWRSRGVTSPGTTAAAGGCSRGSERRPTGHPLVQAADARHALQRYLSRERLAGSVRAQHLLALPHMPVSPALRPSRPARAGWCSTSADLADAAARVRARHRGRRRAPAAVAGGARSRSGGCSPPSCPARRPCCRRPRSTSSGSTR